MKKFGIGYPFEVIIFAGSKEIALNLYKSFGNIEINNEDYFIEMLEEVENTEQFIFDKRLESSPSLQRRYHKHLNTPKNAFLVYDDERGFFEDYQVIK